ncbi:hypothetical protein OIO90_001575 [Microbotryomycetes sp. JL221]|nr:hypothetical protein OIO90_001575 [Microbotryomycetes sp. JL221]
MVNKPRREEGDTEEDRNSHMNGETLAPPDEPKQSKPRKSWRAKYPGFMTPINILWPAKPQPDALPQQIAATKRGAWRARKLVFRAIISTLVCYVLLVEPASLQALGSAAFFCLIVSVMLPPMMPVPVFLLVCVMLVLGMCLGWAWGCAAMAAAIRARDQIILADRLRIAQASAAGAVNPAAEFQRSIFEGQFLDWRSTLVFGVFMAIILFVLGLMRAKNQKLTLVAIFGSIVVDVMHSYGPLFPFARYTLATQFLIPTGAYIAVALASSLLIFPQSLNSNWTTDLVDKFLLSVLQRSKLYSKLLKTPTPVKDEHAWSALGRTFETNQESLSSGLEGLLGTMPMLELEVSHGRTGAKDLIKLKTVLEKVRARSLALGSLWRTVERRHRRGTPQLNKADDPGKNHSGPRNSRHTPRMNRMNERMKQAEESQRHTLADLLPILDESSRPMRTAIEEALIGAMDWLIETNNKRWIGKKPTSDQVEQTFQEQKQRVVKAAVEHGNYRDHRRQRVCEPFRAVFGADGKLLPSQNRQAQFSPGSLLVALNATDTLELYAASMVELLEALLELEDNRRTNKIWWPTGLRKIGNLLRGGKAQGGLPCDGHNPDELTLVDTDTDSGDGDTVADAATTNGARKDNSKLKPSKDKVREEEEWVFALRRHEERDPDARPPKNAAQRMAIRVHNVSVWLHQPETVFAIKYSVVSMLLWVPQIVPSSAFFSYEYKALWALIMFQTGCAVFAGDQVLQTIQKLVGTAMGLLWGCVIWYIGAGRGPGNRIGLGAAFVILFAPVLAHRILSPPSSQMVSMMLAVTTVLVVGYSWVNAHLFTIGNTGLGINLAWKRALLVMIGVGAATIAMIFPRPQTTRALVRRTHATCIHELGRLYAAVISGWLSEDRHDDEQDDYTVMGEKSGHAENKREGVQLHSAYSAQVEKAARARMLAVYLKLNGSRLNIIQSSFELSLKGDWPRDDYLQLLEAQLTLVQAVAQLEAALMRLEPSWRKQLTRSTVFLHNELVADVVSTFYLTSMALRAGTALPEAMPGPLLDRLIYHDSRLRNASGERQPLSDSNSHEEADETLHDQMEGAKLSNVEMTWTVLTDSNFATYASAAIALINILSALDEVEEIVKRLVGEISFPGYRALARHRHHEV